MELTREAQKEHNAEFYPASVLAWMNEATDRAFNVCEKIKVCKNCEHFKTPQFLYSVCEAIGNVTVPIDFGCNRFELKDK